VGEYTVPFFRGLQSTLGHCKKYLNDLQLEYDRLFYGREDYCPFDRLGFFLDDELPMKMVAIGKGITGEYLLF
jgi:hypothetical protein